MLVHMKSLIFKNDWHKGDCHQVRTFLKNIALHNPDWKFYRCHAIERTLHDVPMEYIKELIPDILVEDVWIARDNHKYIFGFGGITPRGYSAIFEHICIKHGLVCDTTDYLPYIDYSLFDIRKVDDFLSIVQKPVVIVSNGDVFSGQISNFSMDPIVDRLKSFFTIVTTKDRKKPGEYFIGDIVGREDEDLSELSYLSTKSHGFVGRWSGPSCFVTVKDNDYSGSLKIINIVNSDKPDWLTTNPVHWVLYKGGMGAVLNKVCHILGD